MWGTSEQGLSHVRHIIEKFKKNYQIRVLSLIRIQKNQTWTTTHLKNMAQHVFSIIEVVSVLSVQSV
jgi:hypothetical protein